MNRIFAFLILFSSMFCFGQQYQVNMSWTAPSLIWSIVGNNVGIGTFQLNEIVTQNNTGASGIVSGVPSSITQPVFTMYIISYTGIADATDVWSGKTSGATFTPTQLPISEFTIAGYNIYRSVAGAGSYQLLNTSINTTTSYSDKTVMNGTTYDYYVETVDTANVSSVPSTIFSIAIPGIKITPATNFTATPTVSMLIIPRDNLVENYPSS